MMTTVPVDAIDASTLQRTSTRSPWIGRVLWLTLTLLLCVTNVLTLLDQDFRNNAYTVLARIAASPALGTVGLSSVAKKIEESNPAAAEKKAVQRATLRLVASSTALQREIESLTTEKSKLVTQRQHLQKQLRASEQLIALHKYSISKLGIRVLSRAGRSVSRHLAALPGHALPVLSATVAVGSVALDIHDACESLKELDELNQSVGLSGVDQSRVCGVAVPTSDEILAAARQNWRKAYDTSAEALNTGAQRIPRLPPSVSLEWVQKWLPSLPGR